MLVHGLWLHGYAMKPLERRLAREGCATHVFSCPSIRLAIDANAERLLRYCERIVLPSSHSGLLVSARAAAQACAFLARGSFDRAALN